MTLVLSNEEVARLLPMEAAMEALEPAYCDLARGEALSPALHQGYESSQQKRKRVEPSFGWMQRIGLLRKVQWRGLQKVRGWFTFVGAAYNLTRLRRLRAEAVAGREAEKSPLHGPSGLATDPSDHPGPSLLRHFEQIRNEIQNENHRQIEYFNSLLAVKGELHHLTNFGTNQ